MRFISFYLFLLSTLAGPLANCQDPDRDVSISGIVSTFKNIPLNSASGFDGKRIKTHSSGPIMIDLVYSNKESSFANAVNNFHLSEEVLREAIRSKPLKGQKDYSIYKNIYELIDNEIHNVRVDGTSVITNKIISINLSSQVQFIVDGSEASNSSYISPLGVKTIKYSDGVDATMYEVRG